MRTIVGRTPDLMGAPVVRIPKPTCSHGAAWTPKHVKSQPFGKFLEVFGYYVSYFWVQVDRSMAENRPEQVASPPWRPAATRGHLPSQFRSISRF